MKISDFGLSREGDRYQMTCTSRLPIKWLSPETLNTGLYTQKSDVFSFGILVWEVFSNGSEPYKGMGNAEMLVSARLTLLHVHFEAFRSSCSTACAWRCPWTRPPTSGN